MAVMRGFWRGEKGCWSEGGSGALLGFMGGTAFWKQKGSPQQVRGLVIPRWPRRLFSCGCTRGTICRSEGGGLGERDEGSADLEDLVFRLCGCMSTKAGTKGPVSQTIPMKTGYVACLLDPRDCGGQSNPTGYPCWFRDVFFTLLLTGLDFLISICLQLTEFRSQHSGCTQLLCVWGAWGFTSKAANLEEDRPLFP